jgi:hypothetical protein
VRPHFGYSWTEKNDDNGRWALYFYNAGPGHAKIVSIFYRIAFHSEAQMGSLEWVKFPHLDAQLRNHGIEQADAELIWIGRPPLIPQQRAVDGLLLGEFSYHALATIEFLDIKISAVDSIGDLHQLLIHSPARLPPKAARIVNSLRMQVETDGDTPLNFSQ